MTFSDNDNAVSFHAHVLEANGDVSESNAPLGALVRRLWPGQVTEEYCKTLRLLADWTKKDFLLKPQRKGIVARSDIVRAFVEPTRAVLIGRDGSPTYAAFLQELKKLVVEHSEDRSFETSVVESIVCASVTVQILRFQLLQPVARSSLDSIDMNQAEDSVMMLYPVKAAISSFTEQMKPIVHGLKELLHSSMEHNEHLGRIQAASARPSRHGSRAGSQGTPAGSFTNEEKAVAKEEKKMQLLAMSYVTIADEEHPGLEEILENWHTAARVLMASAEELISNIEDASRFLDASMSIMRNKLLRFEYLVSVPMFAMTIGNLIAGIFGMNLDKNLPIWLGMPASFALGEHTLFFLAVVVIIFVVLIIWSGLYYFMSRGKQFYRKNSARFGNNKFFQRFSDDEYILSLANAPREVSVAISRGESSVFESSAVRSAVKNDLHTPASRGQPSRLSFETSTDLK